MASFKWMRRDENLLAARARIAARAMASSSSSQLTLAAEESISGGELSAGAGSSHTVATEKTQDAALVARAEAGQMVEVEAPVANSLGEDNGDGTGEAVVVPMETEQLSEGLDVTLHHCEDHYHSEVRVGALA